METLNLFPFNKKIDDRKGFCHFAIFDLLGNRKIAICTIIKNDSLRIDDNKFVVAEVK